MKLKRDYVTKIRPTGANLVVKAQVWYLGGLVRFNLGIYAVGTREQAFAVCMPVFRRHRNNRRRPSTITRTHFGDNP